MTETDLKFGDLIRTLLRARHMKAYELAEKVGVAPTTISKFMNGTIRPKQETFAKICDELCNTDKVKRVLISRYTGTELPADGATEAEKTASLASPETHLLQKTQELAFKNEVENDLKGLDIEFTRDYLTETCCTDFLLKENGEVIALECRYHPIQDIKAEAEVALHIRKQLNCTEAYIVIPDTNGIDSATMKNGIKIIAISQLTFYASGMAH